MSSLESEPDEENKEDDNCPPPRPSAIAPDADSLSFWSDKKQGFVRIKEWEEKRSNTLVSHKRLIKALFR